MKKNIEVPAFKINLFVVLPYLILIVVGVFAFFQWQSNYNFNQANKKLEKKNDSITAVNDKFLKQIEQDSIVIAETQLKVNELLLSDSIQKHQLNTIKWRYEKLKKDYYNSSSADKNKLFTELINN